MKTRKHLVKLTKIGLRTFRSNKIDLTKPFVAEGELGKLFLSLDINFAHEIGIKNSNYLNYIETQFTYVTDHLVHPQEIIIIHEDI